jgi:hypothetical protein
MQGENLTAYTNRMLSASAYRKGIFGAFKLLGDLRSHPYKASSPESRLDFDRIALHAVQSITISVMFAIASLGVGLLSLLLYCFSPGDSPGEPGGLGGVPFFFLVLIQVVGSLIISFELIYYRWAIVRKFLRASYDQDFQPNLPLFPLFLAPLLRFFKKHIIHPYSNQNVITFGRYMPFLGSGGQIASWTMSIDRKPVDDREVGNTRIEIPVQEFYEAADTEVAAFNLPGLRRLNRLLVEGFELKPDGRVLTSLQSAPRSVLNDRDIWEIGQDELNGSYRMYRLYQYTDAERDQVLSYFLRFFNVGSITFVESSAHILPCIDRQRFSLTPVLKDGRTTRLLKTLALAAVLTFFSIYVFAALAYLLTVAWYALTWRREDAKELSEAKSEEEYNYGPKQTFRESIASPSYESYYGVQDLTMYWKATQQAILTGIKKLLKRYGVDTSQFEEVVTSIVNTGVMVSGGNFSAAQVTAGAGASATMGSKDPEQPKGSPLQQVKAAVNRVTTASHQSAGAHQ